MIDLQGVTKRYGDQIAVDDLDLSIADGEFVVLLGPSGCGKTTTLRAINRMVDIDAGVIRIDGIDVRDRHPDELRRHIGYGIQSVGLFPHMTVARNIATVPRLLGWDAARIAERTDEMLQLVGLAPEQYAGKRPRELSGGEAQRVGVARALAADPPVLLMDEP
ncbi:MAG: ATP-binding cassette domain-containing protein, partial [Coriobacteriia bacterium]|nr:ATP-binding cassette domain-containing protein [Coriobacteriia bacterium]